ncbi:MAG: phage tail tape measure protein, partial [Solirubrobacterales bacterium]
MANSSTLTVRILGNASDAIKEVGRLNSVIGTLGKGALLAGGALGAAGLAAGTALFAIGNEFNNIENTIIKGTGATGAALDSLIDQSRDVLQTVPDSGQVVAGALADVNTFFGQTGDTLEESTRLFLDFARVTDADLTTAIGGLDAAFTQFGESPDNLNEALGDFTRISQATGAPVDQLIGQLETFGPTFANAGFSIEETTAIFGQLEQAGVNVTRIGPALNKFFRDTAANGEDPRVALEGMVTAIADAETSADALNLATEAFGSEGAQRLSNAIRS